MTPSALPADPPRSWWGQLVGTGRLSARRRPRLALCADTRFSRFPAREDDETLIGYVHTKDLLGLPAERRDDPIPPEAIRALGTIPAEAKLRQVMRTMQERNAHLALLEGRGIRAGEATVVTLEDVLKELVGEVREATSVR